MTATLELDVVTEYIFTKHVGNDIVLFTAYRGDIDDWATGKREWQIFAGEEYFDSIFVADTENTADALDEWCSL